MGHLKIDEKHISKLCHDLTLMILDIGADIESLEDKDNDVFSRYMSMVRLGSIFKGARDGLNMARYLFTMGFDAQHDYFQTEQAKEHGWDKARLEDNPFFINEDHEDHEEHDKGILIKLDVDKLPDKLKEAIVKAIKEKFSVKKEEVTH